MTDDAALAGDRWDEETSLDFIEYGRYFVPDREKQIDIIVRLLPPAEPGAVILELACGEGLLSEAILEAQPAATVIGLDGSQEMRERAQARLARFDGRFRAEAFGLADRTWRRAQVPVHAIVSSLAIHHLDDEGKQQLFRDLFRMLAPGGALLIADLMKPADEAGWAVAAAEWDEAVKERARTLDGNEEAFAIFERMRWNTYHYFDPDDIDKPSRLVDQLEWLKAAGFVNVDVHYFRAGHAIFGGRKNPAGGR
jgi:tRNA (cmo5U34)-methyltransferase